MSFEEELSLDIGCGFISTLHSKREMIGLDIVKGQLCDIQADGHLLPFRSDVFDQVRFWASLEHFDNPMQGMREAIRVAKDDAVFHFLIPRDARHWMQELNLFVFHFPFGLLYLFRMMWYDFRSSFEGKHSLQHKNMITPNHISRFFKITKCTKEKAPMPCSLGKKGWIIRKMLKDPPKLRTYEAYIIEAKKVAISDKG